MMQKIETERLILRALTVDDFEAVHSYMSCFETGIYMPWGVNTAEEARNYINLAMTEAEKNPVFHYHYAAVLKETDKLIGGCRVSCDGSLCWVLHRDYWKQGYGAEMGKAMMRFGFEELNQHRIFASCDTENTNSYRLMEKLGMRREGTFLEYRPPNKLSDKKYSDTFIYAILRDEWEAQKEIAYYNSLPCLFDGFVEVPELSDGVIQIVCTEKRPAEPERKRVPVYKFDICKGVEKIGRIHLLLEYNDSIYYGGQIGYSIDEQHRGNGHAVRACQLLAPIAKAHGMTKLLISNDITNTASKLVCEKLSARLIHIARVPEWHDLYKDGQRFINIFEWSV
ncbi:MAG: GNAT family N-acetyltransferase [Oscillospiraceae bacterium]|nr:GNAT family N-acetyltransferase [Oscillospiraceae bacterium]